MKCVIRLGLFLGLGCPLVLAVCSLTRQESRTLFQALGDLQEAQCKDEAADALKGQLDQSMAAKDRVVAELAGQRLTLFEAAARFRDASAGNPRFYIALRTYYPGATDDECLCRNVIHYTENVLEGQPHQAAVVARLRAELQDHLDRYGTVSLLP